MSEHFFKNLFMECTRHRLILSTKQEMFIDFGENACEWFFAVKESLGWTIMKSFDILDQYIRKTWNSEILIWNDKGVKNNEEISRDSKQCKFLFLIIARYGKLFLHNYCYIYELISP